MVFYAALAVGGFAVAFTTAAAAAAETASVGTGYFFHIPPSHSSHSSSRNIYSRTPLVLLTSRQQKNSHRCVQGLVGCDTECIDASFQCCHVGQGQACEEGYVCYSQGCCRRGQTCSGPPKGCTATTKMCDNVGCIPRDRVCCGLGDGSSCDAGTVCLDSGLCGRQKSDAGPSSSSGGGGGGGAPSKLSQTATLSTRTDSAIGASTTSSVGGVRSGGGYSLSPVTSTSSSGGDVSSAVSSTSQPKPTTTDKAAAGATLEAPALMAGLFALLAYAAIVEIYFC